MSKRIPLEELVTDVQNYIWKIYDELNYKQMIQDWALRCTYFRELGHVSFYYSWNYTSQDISPSQKLMVRYRIKDGKWYDYHIKEY